jgi:hypothetical protein
MHLAGLPDDRVPGEVHQTWATTDVVAVIVEASGDGVTLGLDQHFPEVTDAT